MKVVTLILLLEATTVNNPSKRIGVIAGAMAGALPEVKAAALID